MEVTTNITQTDIYEDVYVITGQTAKALKEMDLVSATEDEDNVLSPFFKEAAAELSEIISSYGSLTVRGNDILITFQLPSNWKESVKNSLDAAIHNFITNSVCAKWFAMTNRPDMQYYQGKIASNTTNIIKLLCEKSKPTRT